MKLSGWQRLGIIASAGWILGTRTSPTIIDFRRRIKTIDHLPVPYAPGAFVSFDKKDPESKQTPKDKANVIGFLWLILVVGLFLFAHFDGIREVQRRYYAAKFNTTPDKVFITDDPQPIDCNFLTAPLGVKRCHYDRNVQFDSTANTVYVSWVKVKE